MEVILTQDVPTLGTQGAVVTVKDGYARNFLLPRGLAAPATAAAQRVVEQLRRRTEAEAATALAQAQALAQQLATVSCTISATVGEQEKLHGSVTAADIAQALQEHGVVLDKRQVDLDAPIHQLGVYRVSVRLHPQVQATVKVWIVKA